MTATPYMGAPQPTGLLGAASGFGYPLTSGLLGAISNAGGVGPFTQSVSGTPNWTQVALQMAGNPHAGPYATNLGTVPAGTGVPTGSAPSTASQVAGGLLGALGKVPSSTVNGAINQILYGNIGSQAAADGAAADSAVSSQLGNVANDGTAANVAASNDAALSALNSSEAGVPGAAFNGSSAGLASLIGAGDYTDAADAAIGSQLSNVADDGTAASVEASNDAALAANDGGAAGAGAGASGGSGAGGASGTLGDVGTALGALGGAYSLYNEINNYQSGNTASDAESGAETGAAIGSIIPGIGTVIGGLIGGAAGALSSAFGGGEMDPESTTWNNVAGAYNQNPNILSGANPGQLYQNLAGVMDAHNNSPGHSQPIEQVFGREGEGNLMDQLTGYLNQQYQAGKIPTGDSITNQWSQIVAPWLASKNASIANQNTSSGQPEGPALTSDLQGLLQAWEQGLFNSSTPMGISGQTIQGLPAYLGYKA